MVYITFLDWMLLIFLCFTVANIVAETASRKFSKGPYHGKIVACYWQTWSIYRPGRGKFQFEDVDPSLCTHLMFAFTLLDDTDNSVKVLGKWPDLERDKEGRNNITKLKNRYPHLKILASIGGWQDGSIKYSKMAADPEKRIDFVNNTINFIREHNFDGLDLVWEFPTKRGGSLHDKPNFIQLVKELKSEYEKYFLLVTAALGASKDTIDNGYEVVQLSQYLDYMFMMCYDYGGWWSRVITPNAPLHGPDLLNVEYTIKHMLKLGADSEKLILGMPFYGRTFLRLEKTTPPKLGEKFKNQTFNGSYTQEQGFMGYNEICLELFDRKLNWTVYWDETSKTPYAVREEKLIAYDNDRSIAEKIKFAMGEDLGGVMIWSIDTDDFQGDCYEVIDGQKDYPLLRTVNKYIHEHVKYHRKYSARSPNAIASPVLNISSLSFQVNYFTFLVIILSIWHCART